MGNSFQDQFLKAGLVNKQQADKAAKEQRKKKKQKHKKAADIDQSKQLIEQARTEKIERDRQLNQQRVEAAENKAIAAQIKQLIELNRQPRDEGDINFNFVDDNKVKQISVTEKLHQQLTHGVMVIVKMAGSSYEVVPKPVADKIAARSEECVIRCNDTMQQEESDDPYADYKIPDDLMW